MIKIRDKVQKIKGAWKNKSTYKFSYLLTYLLLGPMPPWDQEWCKRKVILNFFLSDIPIYYKKIAFLKNFVH